MKKKILLSSVLFLCFAMAQAQDLQQITVEGVTPGNLLTVVKGKVANYKTVGGLTVKGTIDARDFLIMRDSLSNMTVTNLSDVNINAYTGKEGPKWSTDDVIYPANTLPEDAFYIYTNTSVLASVTLPSSIKTIGRNALGACVKLEEVIIPNSVDSIEENAFISCSSLKSIKLPSQLKRVGELFANCSSLESVELPVDLEALGGFSSCTALKTLEIPTTVKTIIPFSFSWSGLTYIDIPVSVNTIGKGIFNGCNSLATVKIHANVKKLSWDVFGGCTALKVIELPETFESLINLMESESLESIYSNNPIPPTYAYFADATYTNATVYVPKGSLQAYKDAESWTQFTKIVELESTGLGEVRSNVSLTIVGNPVQGSEAKLTFTEAGDGAIIRITDLAGKTVLQQAVATGSTAASMSVVSLSKGIYLVKYTDNEGKLATVKMIK